MGAAYELESYGINADDLTIKEAEAILRELEWQQMELEDSMWDYIS